MSVLGPVQWVHGVWDRQGRRTPQTDVDMCRVFHWLTSSEPFRLFPLGFFRAGGRPGPEQYDPRCPCRGLGEPLLKQVWAPSPARFAGKEGADRRCPDTQSEQGSRPRAFCAGCGRRQPTAACLPRADPHRLAFITSREDLGWGLLGLFRDRGNVIFAAVLQSML